MIRLGADEDLDNHIVRGLRHRLPPVDFVRVQDVGLIGAPDQEVLAWAAEAGRILVSHDASTMTAAAYRRIESCMPMLPKRASRSRWRWPLRFRSMSRDYVPKA